MAELYDKGFCPDCVAQSTERTPGDISTTNGIGRKFYGGAAPCPKCGSVVRTLWWTFAELPLIPLGSYRYKTITDVKINMKRFWARRCDMNWGQVFLTWIAGFAIAAAVVTGVVIYEKHKGH